jgi:hypothetical protein
MTPLASPPPTASAERYVSFYDILLIPDPPDPTFAPLGLEALRAIELLADLGYRAEARGAIIDFVRLGCLARGPVGDRYLCTFPEGIRLARLLRSLGLEEEFPEIATAVRSLIGTKDSSGVIPTYAIFLSTLECLDDVETLAHLSELLGRDPLALRIEFSYAYSTSYELARRAVLLSRLGRPDLAAASAVKALNAKAAVPLGSTSTSLDLEQLRRVWIRLELAALKLSGPSEVSPAALIESAWTEAEKVRHRASERRPRPAPQVPAVSPQNAVPGRQAVLGESDRYYPPGEVEPEGSPFDYSRAVALAQVLAAAAQFQGGDARAIRDRVLERYIALAADSGAALADEIRQSEPMSRALRRLSAAYAEGGDTGQALAIAEVIPLIHHRVSARLFVAMQLAGGPGATAASRAEARRLVEEAEAEITSSISRRRDRSPRWAVCAAVWALLGEPARGLKAREECRLADRLVADATLLMLFATPPGQAPPRDLPRIGRPIPIFRYDPNYRATPTSQPSTRPAPPARA